MRSELYQDLRDIGRRFVAACLVLAVFPGLPIFVAGCNQRPPVTKINVEPREVTIEDAAAGYMKTYAANASLAAAKTAEKCRAGEFRDITAADDFFNEQTKQARAVANGTFSERLTKALADEKGKPAAEVAGVYDKLAEGFGRVGGVSFSSKTKPASQSKDSRSRRQRPP